MTDARYKHGHSSATARSPTYRSWHAMKQRATNENTKGAENYSGRGIDMCEQWADFAQFLADMGERPVGTTLDRIRNAEGYKPDNCRWATPTEQLNNRRNNVFLEHNGRRLTLAQWSAETGIPFSTLRLRLKSGWAIERILTNKRFAKNQYSKE